MDPAEFERLEREERRLRANIKGFDGGDRLTRDEVHQRRPCDALARSDRELKPG
jgi:hypothetical protein